MNYKIAFYSQITASFKNGFKRLSCARKLNRKSNSKAPALRCIIISEIIIRAKGLVRHVEGHICVCGYKMCPHTQRTRKQSVFKRTIGNLRSYDGNCNENVTLKLNFALS